MTPQQLENEVKRLYNEDKITKDYFNAFLAYFEGHQEEEKQPAQEASTIPYLKSEHDLQIIKMKSFGINTESQLFEQMVNGLILLAAKSTTKQPAPEAELFTVPDMIRTIIREYEVAIDKAKAVADKALIFYNKEHENSKP